MFASHTSRAYFTAYGKCAKSKGVMKRGVSFTSCFYCATASTVCFWKIHRKQDLWNGAASLPLWTEGVRDSESLWYKRENRQHLCANAAVTKEGKKSEQKRAAGSGSAIGSGRKSPFASAARSTAMQTPANSHYSSMVPLVNLPTCMRLSLSLPHQSMN